MSGLSGAANITVDFSDSLGLTTSATSDGTYDLSVEREATGGVATFKHAGIAMPGTATASFHYTDFHAKGDAVSSTINGQAQSLADQG